MKHIQAYESFKETHFGNSVNEARSIEKIQRELALVQQDIKQMLARYKARITTPDEKLNIVSALKDLQVRKKDLDAKLNSAIETLYSDAELRDIDEELMIPKLNLNERELADQTIFDLWEEVYGENFIKEYPKMAKIIKTRPNIDRREFARIWDEVYEEDFEEKHSELWDRLE
jgi:pheromone shutdown protein TraB